MPKASASTNSHQSTAVVLKDFGIDVSLRTHCGTQAKPYGFRRVSAFAEGESLCASREHLAGGRGCVGQKKLDIVPRILYNICEVS